MAVQVEATGQPAAADRDWYSRSPAEVTAVSPGERGSAGPESVQQRAEVDGGDPH